MNCPNCKHKFDRPYLQCPNCKANIKLEDIRLTPLENKLLSAFKDKLFLAIPILTTVTAVLSLINDGIPIVSILFSIFFWLAFINAKRGYVTRKNLRAISGTVFATYITNVIIAIFMVITAFISGVILSLPSGEMSELQNIISDKLDLGILNLNQFLNFFVKIPALFFVIYFIIVSISILIPNLLWRHKVHNFTKSLYTNLEKDIESPEISLKARNSLFILSSIRITESLFSFPDVLSVSTSVTFGVAGVLTAILIDKYFIKETQNKE